MGAHGYECSVSEQALAELTQGAHTYGECVEGDDASNVHDTSLPSNSQHARVVDSYMFPLQSAYMILRAVST
eukprot:4687818-Karenia_brevis.AAC.1